MQYDLYLLEKVLIIVVQLSRSIYISLIKSINNPDLNIINCSVNLRNQPLHKSIADFFTDFP